MTESTWKESLRLPPSFGALQVLSKGRNPRKTIFEGVTARMGGMDSFFTARSPASTGSPPC